MPAETKRLGIQVGGDASGFNNAAASAITQMNNLKRVAAGVGGVMAAGLATGGAAAVKSAGSFQQAMDQSLAIMDDVSQEQREQMETTAREVAKSYDVSAKKAAESYYYLASAGLDAADSEEKLGEMAEFAQAGQFDMAQATDILTDAASGLGMELEDYPQIADKLVQANQMANASVEQFGEALINKAAGKMRVYNVALDDGISMLAQFADTGLKGRRAGTILARTLDGLVKRARKNSDAFKELGIQVYDSDGNLRNAYDIISDLQGALGDLSTKEKSAAMEMLGFNKRAENGINRLIGNKEAIKEYNEDLDSAGGSTGDVADKQMQGFNKQVGLMTDKVKDLAIELGDPLLQPLTNAVKKFGNFADNLQTAAAEADSIMEFVENIDDMDIGAVDFVLEPSIEFGTSVDKAVKSSEPVKNLIDTGVEHPISMTLGLGAGAATLSWVAGSATGLVSSILSFVATPLGLGTLAATATIGLRKLDKEIGEAGYDSFSKYAQEEWDIDMTPSFASAVDDVYETVQGLRPKNLFKDVAKAWETWEEEGGPLQDIDWGETFRPPEIDWSETLNPIPDETWEDILNWKGWEFYAEIGKIGKSAWESYVNWPGWDTFLEWEGWDWLTDQIGKIPWPDVNLPPWLQTLVDMSEGGWASVIPGIGGGGEAPADLMEAARDKVDPTKTGGLRGDEPLIGNKEINKLQQLFQDQNASEDEKVSVINQLLSEAQKTVEQGKAEKSDLTESIINLQQSIDGWSSEMWQLEDMSSNQSGTPWTGNGPRNEVAGVVHRQEAVLPSHILRGGPGPILDFLGYNPGQGSLNAGTGQTAGKLDKIEQNTAKVADKLEAVAGGAGGQITVDINGITSLEEVLARITEEWDDQKRAVGR